MTVDAVTVKPGPGRASAIIGAGTMAGSREGAAGATAGFGGLALRPHAATNITATAMAVMRFIEAILLGGTIAVRACM
jgi:hypothetical protein